MSVDLKKAKEEALKEIQEESQKKAKEKIKSKLRELKRAQIVVKNIEREIEDLNDELFIESEDETTQSDN